MRRVDKDEVWCRKNVTAAEHRAFWENWCQTQWGMPDFAIMRRRIEARRAATN